MQPRLQQPLLKTPQSEYIPAPFTGNKSNYLPVGDSVMVRVDIAAPKSSGGIAITDNSVEMMQSAATTGVIVACGDEAFKWNTDRTRPFDGRKPIPGDRVIFEKYAGHRIFGEDRDEYRLMTDKCIGAFQLTGKQT